MPEPSQVPTNENIDVPERLDIERVRPQTLNPRVLALQEKLDSLLDSGVYCPKDAVILQLKAAIEEAKASSV